MSRQVTNNRRLGRFQVILCDRTSRVKKAIATVAGIFALSFVWQAESSPILVPKDSKLIRVFQDHHDELERLRQMATEDTGKASYFSETKITDLLPEPRRREYKNLLRLSRGLAIGVDSNGSVRFIFASKGQAIGSDWAKGIQYVPDKVNVIGDRMNALDGLQNLPTGVYLRELEPHWYLFYQRDE